MSQPVPPEQPESTPAEPAESAEPVKPVKPAKSFRERLPKVSRNRGVALGVAVVLVGGAAVGTAAVLHHDQGGRGDRGHLAAQHDRAGGDDGSQRSRAEAPGRGSRGNDGFSGSRGGSRAGSDSGSDSGSTSGQSTQESLAPAPVPAVAAAKAIEAATAAVSGGKPYALRVIGQQGGGSAWEVGVLGADGVRHLVTIDGATGTVTGNTVAPAAS